VSQPIDIEQLRQMRDAEHCFLAAFEGRISSKLTVKLMEDLPSLLDELADLRAYKERTEAGLHKLSGMIDHFCDVTEDEMRALGLWRDPPQAEVQP